MSVEQLLHEHGMHPEEVVGWARLRAGELLADIDDPLLEALLSDVEVGPPPAFAETASTSTPAYTSHASEVAVSSEGGTDDGADEELEELDVEELEELDFDEVDLVEDDEHEEHEEHEERASPGDDHDFLGAESSDSPAGGEIAYAPTDTQPLEAVDAEILEDSGSFAVDELEAEADAEHRGAAADAEPAPQKVEDEGSGDLFDDDELDIDIEE